MAYPEPKTPQEIQAFKAVLEKPAPDLFAGVNPATLDEFKRDYCDLFADRPWYQVMLPQWGPLWFLILTSILGMRWGVIFWAFGLGWLFVVGFRRFRAQRDRWAGLAQRGRAAGIFA